MFLHYLFIYLFISSGQPIRLIGGLLVKACTRRLFDYLSEAMTPVPPLLHIVYIGRGN